MSDRGYGPAFLLLLLPALLPGLLAAQGSHPLPTGKLVFGMMTGSFSPDGRFEFLGQDLPPLKGSWEVSGNQLTLRQSEGCPAPGSYAFRLDSGILHLELIADECGFRNTLLDGSRWRPEGTKRAVASREFRRKLSGISTPLPTAAGREGSWPSFRGEGANGIAEGMNLPQQWNGETGENILWKRPIPGLAHSSPVIWGNRIFVTSAISSRSNASFKPGLYGDGVASEDRSEHRWTLYAIDKRTGEILWERIAFEGVPREKRHIKSTYASSTPVTDGRMVIAFFGSQGVYAYDVEGNFRWSVDLGRLNAGAYNAPTFEWGTASSPILWDEKVILQCDTQEDSFLVALDLETGGTVWKTDREELPSWGTPTVIEGPEGPELITNASVFIRGYDARTGRELWKLGGSSRITAPTPIFSQGLLVVASGRGPERPIFVLQPGGRGDLTLPEGETSSEWVAWSRQGRGPYMPTPLIYGENLYVLANNGIFDAYDLASGEELYRARIPHQGSGFSASPVAADGKIYLSNEDGDMIVVAAGPQFEHLTTNPMGELLMATPALSEGVMFVRSVDSLFAIGRAP